MPASLLNCAHSELMISAVSEIWFQDQPKCFGTRERPSGTLCKSCICYRLLNKGVNTEGFGRRPPDFTKPRPGLCALILCGATRCAPDCERTYCSFQLFFLQFVTIHVPKFWRDLKLNIFIILLNFFTLKEVAVGCLQQTAHSLWSGQIGVPDGRSRLLCTSDGPLHLPNTSTRCL